MDKLLIEPEIKWFDHKFKNEPPTEFEPIKDLEKIHSLRNEAKKLYDQDVINYTQYREKTKRSDQNWIKTVLQTGTTGDKISANSILIQDSAVHNLNALENLIQSVKLSKKRECMLAIDSIKDLFVHFLLPKRALRSFHEHPFEYLNNYSNENNMRDKRLLLWYFESLLKVKYSNFIKALQLVFQDTLATTKFKVASVLVDLMIANRMEQQKVMLDLIVNKLGDPDYQVASRVIYQIKNFLSKCPKIKMDVLIEIERLVSRQNINPRAQYYGFCCMNQMILTKQDMEVSNRLLVIYFSFFKKFVKNKEVDSRMLSALLTGVNRAYKYAKMDNEEIDKNLDTLFKLVHITTFNVSIQALMLLNQVIESREDLIHRYYNALYRKMLDLECKNTSKQTYFLNLLYNSIIKDEALPRIKAFVKRLLQICFVQTPPFICGSFMLLSELLKTKKNIFQFDHSLLVRNNLLTDDSMNSMSKFGEQDDDDEKFVDVKSESENEEENKKNHKDESNSNQISNGKNSTSWLHKKNIIFKKHNKYDIIERNPLYCGADKTLTYELLLYSKHYHPTVVVFANKLLDNEPVEYTGDPMEDFTLMHFLDRFVYKNPKRSKDKDQKKAKKSVFEPVKSIARSSIKNMAINSKEYLKLDPSQIPEEEKLFYNYYKTRTGKAEELDGDVDSEAESISDTEFDAYLSKTEVDGADGNDDWTVDFAESLSKNKKSKKKKKQDEANEALDESMDEEMDDDELVDEFDDDEDFENAMNEEDMDMEDFDKENEEFEEEDMFIGNKPKRVKEDISNLFAAADEFTDLLNDSSKYDELGVGSISNKDNADPKQLRWEMNRDDFVSGKNWKKSNKVNKKFKIKDKKENMGKLNKKTNLTNKKLKK